MLRAYLLKTGRDVSPFGPLRQLSVHNMPLAEHQERALRAAGCDVRWIDDPAEMETPCLLAHDDVYFTRGAVRGLLRGARRSGGNVQAALRVSMLTEALAPELQGELQLGRDGAPDARRYDLFLLRDVDPAVPHQLQTRPAVIEARFAKRSSRTHPRFSEQGRFVMPISTVYLSPVRHWAHLVACNLLGMGAYVLAEARRQWLQSAMMPLSAALRSSSLRPARLLSKTYWKGDRCRVHPSAHVEGSVLGHRVRIEPNAVVRYCVVGDGAVIGAGACLEGCTVGNRTLVNGSVQIHGSVFGDEASIGAHFNQLSVVGRRAVICPDAGIQDFSLNGTVPVMVDGETVRSGSLVLGAAVGDETFLGPGIQVAGGREVPANCVLVRSGEAPQPPENVHRLDRRRAA